MGSIKKSYGTAFKAKEAIVAVKEIKTVGQIASEFQVHPIQVGIWKKRLLEGADSLFSDKEKQDRQKDREEVNELYRQIGQLKVETDWLKKKVGLLE